MDRDGILGKLLELVNLERLFGGKPWFRSVTGWGLVILATGSTALSEACGLGLIGVEECATAQGVVDKVGMIITALGIRREQGKAKQRVEQVAAAPPLPLPVAPSSISGGA